MNYFSKNQYLSVRGNKLSAKQKSRKYWYKLKKVQVCSEIKCGKVIVLYSNERVALGLK